MIIGFQLDSKAKSVPVGLRIVLTLRSPDNETSTIAVSAIGVIQNYLHEPSSPKPDPRDEVWIEPTPESNRQRFIVHTPGNQRLLLGDFFNRISLEVAVERVAPNGWITTNKVLIILHKTDIKIFQAREFALDLQQSEVDPIEEQIVSEIIKSEPNHVDSENSEVTLSEEDSVSETNLVQISESTQNLEQNKSTNSQISNRDELPVDVPESRVQLSDLAKLSKKLSRALRFVVGIILILIPIVIFSPLSFVPLDQPEKEKSKLVITWPSTETVIGETVVVSLIDLDGNNKNYLGTIENKSTTAYLLRSGENFVQIDANQIQGRVIISIPFIGKLFQLI